MKTYANAFLVFLFAVLACNTTIARDTLSVSEMKMTPLSTVFTPILIDSVDVNNKSFEVKKILQSSVDFDKVRNSETIIKADKKNVFTLDKVLEETNKNKGLQLFSFTVDADRYCTADFIIKSTDMLEVYVDGKKERSKETREDSLSKAKDLKINMKLEPRRYEIIIKRFTELSKSAEYKMKVDVKLPEKDTTTQLVINSKELRNVTIHDILEGSRTASASISPSGEYYYLSVYTTYPGGRSVYNNELKELKTNKTIYRFPSGVSLQWVKNKDQLMYTRTGAQDRELVVMDIPSLEETVLVKGLKGGSFLVSPDGQYILVSQREEIPADKGELKRVLSPSDHSGSFRGRASVCLYNMKDGTYQQVTYGKTSTYILDISADSKKALMMLREETITERPFSTSTMLELDLETLTLDTLFRSQYVDRAQYSPDNKTLLVIGNGDAFDGVGLNVAEGQMANMYDKQAFLYDIKNKKVDPITRNFNPSVNDVQWFESDKIYFRVEDKDSVNVYTYNIKAKEFAKIDLPEEIISSFQVATKKPVAIFRGESNNNAYRVYSYDLKSKKSTLLSDPFKEQLDELSVFEAQTWTFESEVSNTIIDGRYYLPPNFNPENKYPMIVYYYGGTSPTMRAFESNYPSQVYASLGYVVYVINPSGATGYGQEFAARHVNAWGDPTADEIIEGTKKFCEEHPFVDSSKIGCIGASYGGFMTQYLQTQTDLFAAAVSHAGISSITSYWGEGYWGYAYSSAASANSYPWNNPDLYVKQSPLFNADKINTPLLLLHGMVDTNVPIGESIQMFNALKILGKEVEFIKVADENHGISNYKRRLEWHKTIYAWFAKWLKDQPEWWDSLYPER
ncbi:dipeptidyl aminopeptidase/acylaminoacyl peptidase [Dysgonomonadaceae bacterium PH5-43]|nr:dipeptidyl aminopeptidase/acylaminoacyl peptidase [Dysgonomonadaceae bacterium PH5-43]